MTIFYFGIFITLVIIFLFVLFVTLRKNNYLAFALLLPYFGFGLLGAGWLIRSEAESKIIKRFEIEEMQQIRNITIEETAAIILHSQIAFGDGLHYAGVVVHSSSDYPLKYILKQKGITKNENMAMVWLINAKASKLSIQGKLLFVVDKKEADKGMWIGWVDEHYVSEVTKMDSN